MPGPVTGRQLPSAASVVVVGGGVGGASVAFHLAELGVTDVVMRFQDTYTVHPDDDALGVRLDALRRYADDVIVAVRG